MDFKTNRKIIDEAINSGCKTISELALYLKLRGKISLVTLKDRESLIAI